MPWACRAAAAACGAAIALSGAGGIGSPARPGAVDACPAAVEVRPLPLAAAEARPSPGSSHTTPSGNASNPSPTADYRHRLTPTPYGWPRLDHWCVWIEPGADTGPAALWDGRWRQAVDGALEAWRSQLPITVVDEPQRAQVLVLRRRPPLQNRRASHGRAELSLREVRHGTAGQASGGWILEPLVTVQLSPGQGLQPMQATALHELGHAFGLWGHSDQAGDAMAAVPGARPVLTLSPRDRATLRWLQAQPGLATVDGVSPAGGRPAARLAPAAPGAN